MRTTLLANALVCVATTTTVILVGGGIAFAHVDPDPLAIEAGSTGTIGFTIEHGCDGSPTTDLKFEVPEGVTGVAPVDKDGWTTTVAGNTVEFKGGPLAADQEDSFEITLTAPAQAGDIHFPVIQTCEQGELAWVEIAAEGAAEPEHPAPTLKVTEGPPTSADLMPEEEEATTSDAATGDTAPSVTTAAPAPDDESSNTGTIVVVVVVAAVALAGGGVVLARRRGSAPKS